MSDFTRKDVLNEAAKILNKTNEKEKTKKLIENAGVLISLAVIILSLVLYAYNTGFSKVYNIPTECFTLNITTFLPLAIQFCGVAVLVLSCLSSVKADNMLNKRRINPLRVLHGSLAIMIILHSNNFDKVYQPWIIISFAILIPLLFEIGLYAKKGPLKNKKVSADEHIELLEKYIEEHIFYTYYMKYGLFIVVILVLLAPKIGAIGAKAEREYQCFKINDQSYAVIVNYQDRVLAQHVNIQENVLIIDTRKYQYFLTEEIDFELSTFDDVVFIKSTENAQGTEEMARGMEGGDKSAD